MPKSNRSKKQAARRKTAATGVPHAAVVNGTAHRHPAPDFGVLDSRPYGVTRQVNLAPAAALVSAARAGCRPCQKTAIPAVLAGDRLVVATLAGTPFSLLPSIGFLSPASVKLWQAGRRMLESAFEGEAPAAPMLALLESLSQEELRDVLEDALDLWARLGAVPEEAAAPFVGEREEHAADDEDDLPEATAPPENPFAGEGLVYLSADQLADGIPLPMLLQSAVAGTVEDRITEHAHDLFDTLAERGPDAVREAVLLLAQYVLSGGAYGAGIEDSVRYYRQQPPPDLRAPALTILHLLLAAYIAHGRTGAEALLDDFDDVAADTGLGVLRLLFCIAVLASGWPADRQQALTEELCADVR
ncbi:hypothetical protein [Kitasatospora sp. NPDC088134]|uniref:hypothetical protein n=1 Tax=Kitasatospora sp. NPDC088134 TaxID=3364071 RepID=UPI0037FBF261